MAGKNDQKGSIGKYVMAALAIIIILAMILSSLRIF
jgi:hypothetical protein